MISGQGKVRSRRKASGFSRCFMFNKVLFQGELSGDLTRPIFWIVQAFQSSFVSSFGVCFFCRGAYSGNIPAVVL